MNKAVDQKLTQDSVAGAHGVVPFHSEPVGQVFVPEIGKKAVGVLKISGHDQTVVVALLVVGAYEGVGLVDGTERADSVVLSQQDDGSQVVSHLPCGVVLPEEPR